MSMKIYASQDWVNEQITTKITTPTVAEAGQTIVIKSVDESGKPIEWETANILPPITEADNGKVLMVVNGQWQLVTLNLSVDENGVITN